MTAVTHEAFARYTLYRERVYDTLTTLLEYRNEVTQSNFEELEHITYTD